MFSHLLQLWVFTRDACDKSFHLLGCPANFHHLARVYRRMPQFRGIFLLAFWFTSIAILAPLLIALVLITKNENFIFSPVRLFIRMGLAMVGVRVEASGIEKLDPNQTYIFTPNHHRETHSNKQTDRRINKVFIFGYEDQCDQQRSQERDRCEPEGK